MYDGLAPDLSWRWRLESETAEVLSAYRALGDRRVTFHGLVRMDQFGQDVTYLVCSDGQGNRVLIMAEYSIDFGSDVTFNDLLDEVDLRTAIASNRLHIETV